MNSKILEIRTSLERGRGVFALKKFIKGERITVAPVIPISKEESQTIRKQQFSKYLYEWEFFPEDQIWSLALVGGEGLFFNHSYQPNANYYRFGVGHENNPGAGILYYALRDIEADEEIFVNYNGEPDSKEPVGFSVY